MLPQGCELDQRGQPEGAGALAFVRIVKPLRIVKMSRVLKLFVRFRCGEALKRYIWTMR